MGLTVDREGLEAEIGKMEAEKARADAANDPERSAYYEGAIAAFKAVLEDLPVRFGMSDGAEWHNHLVRELQPPGECPACDAYHGEDVLSQIERMRTAERARKAEKNVPGEGAS